MLDILKGLKHLNLNQRNSIIMSVILYSKSACKPCIETKMYLKQIGVEYIERDGTSEANQGAVLKAVEQTGFRMFPILQIGENFVVGKNFTRIAELLRA